MSNTKNYFNPEGFDSATQKTLTDWLKYIESGAPLNQSPSDSGFFHTEGHEPTPVFKPAKNSKILGKKNAQIVFGTDRPTNITSGKGALGAQGANTIDLVVGRMASTNDGQGPKDGTIVNNSFAADAARIYISQLTDIDKNFVLAEGSVGQSANRSAIGIKADAVRIIGREGVKIVTGRSRVSGFGGSGETNSVGGKIEPAPPIDLIAGNNTDSKRVWGGMFHPFEEIPGLQPVTKGNNTVDALRELHQIIGEIWSAVFNFALIQTGYNGTLGVTPMSWIASASVPTTTNQLTQVLNSLYQTRVNAMLWEVDYLKHYGYKYICSRNVRAN